MNSFQILTFVGIVFYTLSLSCSLYINMPRRIDHVFEFKKMFILSFLFIFSIYIYPLSLFFLSGDVASGDISPDIYNFGSYIPFSLFLSSVFILIVSMVFKQLSSSKELSSKVVVLSNIDVSLLSILFLFCVYLLMELGKSVGGIAMLVLKGYSVTEVFIGKGQYAVAFEWISTIIILFFSNSLLKRNKLLIWLSVSSLLFMVLIFSVMGRRAAVVVLIGTALMCYNLLYARIKLVYLVLLVSVGFLFLTYVGFLRGQSFDDVSTGIESIQKKSDRLSDDEGADMLYTLKTGNFAVPFETLPKIISSSGESYYYGFGYYSLSSIFNIIPTFIWENRPIPLSNWYMKEFYGVSNLNEGRQFFLLTAPYMDLGPFGVVIFAIILGVFFVKVNSLYINYSKNTLVITLISLFFGCLMNMISNDFLGFIIAFVKGYAFPILILLILKKALKIAVKI